MDVEDVDDINESYTVVANCENSLVSVFSSMSAAFFRISEDLSDRQREVMIEIASDLE